MAAKRKRRWRDYRTEAGGRPVKEFIDELDDDSAASVVAAMREVRDLGTEAAKHLRGDIYEVIANSKDKWIRILFAPLGKSSHILLAVHGFEKKTRKTPPQALDLAEERLAKWKARGKARRKGP